jgi:hypothetical protein
MAVACAFAQYIATLIETMLPQIVEWLSVNENVSMSQFDLVD